MSCPPYNLNDYFFGELGEAEHRAVRTHLEACPGCRAELERLRLTQTTLLALRDEEVPRRISFVSDKVFERRWWHRPWRPGFASAALIAAAIVAHALIRPPAPVAAPAPDTAQIEQRIGAEVARRLAESEARQAAALQKAVTDIEFQRKADMLQIGDTFTILSKRLNQRYMASVERVGDQP